ncbi:uncharacterized protein BDW70DRAFT_60164 [Aspergillus foveolatus]|uniref:uncharacterized protein n=1 Tax=Aspergillus foveolatus TaxID=210207 RepID=UPI003CCCB4BF
MRTSVCLYHMISIAYLTSITFPATRDRHHQGTKRRAWATHFKPPTSSIPIYPSGRFLALWVFFGVNITCKTLFTRR